MYTFPLIIRTHFLPISLILLLHVLPLHSHSQNSSDLQALLSFKSIISPDGVLFSWDETDTSRHFCSWRGVACDSPQNPNRITSLSLDSLNLTGTISPYLANLTYLTKLNLSSNYFRGRIPSEFGRLSNLQYLDLRFNLLEGDIPLSLTHCSKLVSIQLKNNNLVGRVPSNFSQCKDLNAINFGHNKLTGTIPSSLSLLRNLSLLGLWGNQLTGGIPPSFGNLSSLEHIDLSENSLEGHIPDELGNLLKLKSLALTANNFSGEIPKSLFNISSIYYFNVGNNNLSGVLPHDLGSTLPNLKSFYVFYNQLTGFFPASAANASSLEHFVLHGNMFFGPIVKNLGLLPNLTGFDLGRNQLEVGDWEFLNSLSNCSNLSTLYLSENNLQGFLPSSVANLSSQLTWLAMAGNQIYGSIPIEIGRYNRLALFDMTSTLLSGIIPPTIGMLQNLHVLSLSDNQFYGQIPTSIGNLTELNDLNLAENNLQGNIPGSIGNLISLGALNLSYNYLNGSIPEQAIGHLVLLSKYLDLSHNMLNGQLPSQIGGLINLNMIDVSENRLSGKIPSSLGACQLLGCLFMQGNSFEGTIPSTLGELKGIQQLDLSHNNLSGPIPNFLQRLHLLFYLNLSFNDLEGEVPQVGIFGNKSAIAVFGNNKLCGGIRELHLHSCENLDEVSTHRSSLLKAIIPVIIAAILVVLMLTVYLMRRARKKASPQSPDLKESFLQISYEAIHKATNGFSSSNLLGVGGFGSVYKGIMDFDQNRVLAIKVVNLEQAGAEGCFMAECNALRVIRHRNIVSVVTICLSIDHNGNDFKALVFDYMPNGSLDEWLHRRRDTNSRSLNLLERWNIVMDVALALDYLHNHCQAPIVHCDLKPSNILLDDDMNARVGDFGLSRFLLENTGSSEETNDTIGIRGSIGYLAPEQGLGGSITTQVDVYGYGVLLLETFTGKRPTDEIFQSDLTLPKYVEMAYPDHVLDIVDPSIVMKNEGKTEDQGWLHECMLSLLRLGLLCSKESPNERMKMGDIIKELLHVKEDILRGWTQNLSN